jgi:hypothetical protein
MLNQIIFAIFQIGALAWLAVFILKMRRASEGFRKQILEHHRELYTLTVDAIPLGVRLEAGILGPKDWSPRSKERCWCRRR